MIWLKKEYDIDFIYTELPQVKQKSLDFRNLETIFKNFDKKKSDELALEVMRKFLLSRSKNKDKKRQ